MFSGKINYIKDDVNELRFLPPYNKFETVMLYISEKGSVSISDLKHDCRLRYEFIPFCAMFGRYGFIQFVDPIPECQGDLGESKLLNIKNIMKINISEDKSSGYFEMPFDFENRKVCLTEKGIIFVEYIYEKRGERKEAEEYFRKMGLLIPCLQTLSNKPMDANSLQIRLKPMDISSIILEVKCSDINRIPFYDELLKLKIIEIIKTESGSDLISLTNKGRRYVKYLEDWYPKQKDLVAEEKREIQRVLHSYKSLIPCLEYIYLFGEGRTSVLENRLGLSHNAFRKFYKRVEKYDLFIFCKDHNTWNGSLLLTKKGLKYIQTHLGINEYI